MSAISMRSLVFLSLLYSCAAKIHELSIQTDDRSIFSVETFGFVPGGTMDFVISDFKFVGPSTTAKFGFVAFPTDSDADMSVMEETVCFLDDAKFVIDMSASDVDWSTPTKRTFTIRATEEGLYRVMFQRCSPGTEATFVSFQLGLTMMNPGPDYLSIGESPLPAMYLLGAAIFAGLSVVWAVLLRKHREKSHRVHVMMLLLLVLKTLSLFFNGASYAYEKVHGTNSAWRTMYLIFAFLKGVTLFVVILLIGTGWSLLKPFLSDKEKKVLMVVLSLQVLDNIALVVVSETAPGSQAWLSWTDWLHLLDIACCCAVLFPIVWSIRNLRIAAQADGQASRSLQKLEQFRSFYLWVVGYVYFTRIVVYFLAATVSYLLTWSTFMSAELATLLFFVATGYKFRPQGDNPYLRVHNSDDEDEAREQLEDAFGNLDDDSVEMTSRERHIVRQLEAEL